MVTHEAPHSQDLRSGIYVGQVMHHRFAPRRHRFIYRVFSFCLDLDELPLLSKRLRWFNKDCFGLFSFHERDHGLGQGSLRDEITQLLSDRGYTSATARIELLCYPRILGYTFNPLSVYFCYNDKDQLQLILYEVSNTFGQRHSYMLFNDQPEQQIIRQNTHKRMYVSPFMPMDTDYNFRIRPPGSNVSVCIRQNQNHDDETHPILHATFTGQRVRFSDRNLLKLFFSHPLMTLKVIGAIHWEALRLWLKGVSLQPRKTSRSYSISWADSEGDSHYEVL